MSFYFSPHDDLHCYVLQYFKDFLKENDLKEIILFKAKRETKCDYFYCKGFDEVGEAGNCGRQCEKYIPNNGKNGRCKYYGYCYEQTKDLMVLKLD